MRREVEGYGISSANEAEVNAKKGVMRSDPDIGGSATERYRPLVAKIKLDASRAAEIRANWKCVSCLEVDLRVPWRVWGGVQETEKPNRLESSFRCDSVTRDSRPTLQRWTRRGGRRLLKLKRGSRLRKMGEWLDWKR